MTTSEQTLDAILSAFPDVEMLRVAAAPPIAAGTYKDATIQIIDVSHMGATRDYLPTKNCNWWVSAIRPTGCGKTHYHRYTSEVIDTVCCVRDIMNKIDGEQ